MTDLHRSNDLAAADIAHGKAKSTTKSWVANLLLEGGVKNPRPAVQLFYIQSLLCHEIVVLHALVVGLQSRRMPINPSAMTLVNIRLLPNPSTLLSLLPPPPPLPKWVGSCYITVLSLPSLTSDSFDHSSSAAANFASYHTRSSSTSSPPARTARTISLSCRKGHC